MLSQSPLILGDHHTIGRGQLLAGCKAVQDEKEEGPPSSRPGAPGLLAAGPAATGRNTDEGSVLTGLEARRTPPPPPPQPTRAARGEPSASVEGEEGGEFSLPFGGLDFSFT